MQEKDLKEKQVIRVIGYKESTYYKRKKTLEKTQQIRGA
jgi:hypothetical protein